MKIVLKMIENKIIFNRETDQENTKKRKWTHTTTVLERENVGSDLCILDDTNHVQ